MQCRVRRSRRSRPAAARSARCRQDWPAVTAHRVRWPCGSTGVVVRWRRRPSTARQMTVIRASQAAPVAANVRVRIQYEPEDERQPTHRLCQQRVAIGRVVDGCARFISGAEHATLAGRRRGRPRCTRQRGCLLPQPPAWRPQWNRPAGHRCARPRPRSNRFEGSAVNVDDDDRRTAGAAAAGTSR